MRGLGDIGPLLPALGPAPVAEVSRLTVPALRLAQVALQNASRECRYHETDFSKAGWFAGAPRCDSCKQPWRVTEALAAVEAAIEEAIADSSVRRELAATKATIAKLAESYLATTTAAAALASASVNADEVCPYTQAHTRNWCGYVTCRES